jgi:hypothetical protein
MSSSSLCPCRGTVARVGEPRDSAHAIWVAFLAVENNHYAEETWGLDYACLPTNRLTSTLSGSPYFHCQLLFWDAAARTSRTYSVDATTRCVFTEPMKEFGSVGWVFVRLEVTQAQECAVRDFLDAQVGKPFSARAYGVFCMPTALARATSDGSSWFCSELVVAALQAVGFLPTLERAATNPGTLYRVLLEDPSVRASFGALHVVAEQRTRAAVADVMSRDERDAAARRAAVFGTAPAVQPMYRGAT